MCNKLLQLYACNHSKVICTTPCPHALVIGTRVSLVNSEQGISRSSSIVSLIAPSVRRSAVADLPCQQQRSPTPSPLRASSTSVHRDPAPAFRFIGPNQAAPAPVSPPPGYPGHESPVSLTSTWSGPSQHSASPTGPPLPVSPSFPTLPNEEYTIEPNFCPYHFPRYLPQSNQPCLDCYMLPEWEQHPREWANKYRLDHFLEKPGDAESLSGVEALRRRHEERMKEGR